MAALRAVKATTDGVNLNNYGSSMLAGAFPFSERFQLLSAGLSSPRERPVRPRVRHSECQHDDKPDQFHQRPDIRSVGPNTKTDISQYVNVAGNVTSLLTLINTNIMHGQMPTDMYSTLSTTLSSPAFT